MKMSKTMSVLAFAFVGCSSDPSPTPPTGPTPAVNNGFQITVSGEDLAVNGYEWAPGAKANDDPPAFVDGWAVKFEHIIVTIGEVRLNADPDKDPANPETQGEPVATATGPWAVDLTIGGNIVGKSGSPDEKTVAITTIDTKSDGTAFDPAQRYAFNYTTVGASPAAKAVNLDAAGQALYETAKTNGWATIYAGTATYKGPAPAAGSVFEKIPTVVKFTLGLKNPTAYVNCQNTDLQATGGDEFPRGLQASKDKATTAQITIHTDHSFWSKLNVEGTELHFDPIAARASTYGTVGAAPGTVTLDDLVNVDVTGFKTKNDEPLPARSLVPDYTAAAGQLAFDANGTTFAKANSYAAYIAYSATAGGHLNADGLCKVKLGYAP